MCLSNYHDVFYPRIPHSCNVPSILAIHTAKLSSNNKTRIQEQTTSPMKNTIFFSNLSYIKTIYYDKQHQPPAWNASRGDLNFVVVKQTPASKFGRIPQAIVLSSSHDIVKLMFLQGKYLKVQLRMLAWFFLSQLMSGYLFPELCSYHFRTEDVAIQAPSVRCN